VPFHVIPRRTAQGKKGRTVTYQFKLTSEITEPLHPLIAIAGGSATGKTYSALLLAESMAEGKTFAVIDTEAGRARHYKSRFDFAHCDFTPFDEKGECVGYPPERYIDVIDAAEKAGFPVIVIDSFSHVWEGMGGVLEMHAEALDAMVSGDEAKRDKVSVLAWGKVKPRYRRLLHRIIQCRASVIICIRAKQRVEQRRGVFLGKSKIRKENIEWDVACDKDLIFEMTASFLLTPERIGVPIALKLPDELSRAFPPDRQLDGNAGKAVLKWSTSGGASGQADKTIVDLARAEARKGHEAINEYWKTLSKPDRDLLLPVMAELKRISAEADRSDDEIPFGKDDDDPEGAEYEARVKAEAEAALAAKGGDK
jgi:hypothetical protein